MGENSVIALSSQSPCISPASSLSHQQQAAAFDSSISPLPPILQTSMNPAAALPLSIVGSQQHIQLQQQLQQQQHTINQHNHQLLPLLPPNFGAQVATQLTSMAALNNNTISMPNANSSLSSSPASNSSLILNNSGHSIQQQQQQNHNHHHQQQFSGYSNNQNNSPASPSASNNSATATTSAQMHCTADYLSQLLKDRKQLAAFPNVFLHIERLLDDGELSIVTAC